MATPSTPAKKRSFLLPDGSTLDLPENLTQEDKYRISLDLAERFPDQYQSLLDPYQTFLGGTAEFFKGIPRGVAGSLAGAAQGLIGLATPGIETDVEKDLFAFQNYLENESSLSPDEAYKDFLGSKLGAGLGSVATYAMPGGVAKILGASPVGTAARASGAALAGAGGAGEQAQRIEAERVLGEEVTLGQELGALALGTGIGFTELYPVEKLFKRVTPETGSALLNIFSRIDKNNPVTSSLSDDILRLTKGALSQGAAEGLQEGLAGVAQDVASKITFDDEIEVGRSFLDDLLVGGGVGAIADVIVDAMGGRRTVSNKLFKDKEEKLRRQRIDRINEIAAQKIAERNKQEADRVAANNNIPLALPSPAQVTGGYYLPTEDTVEGVYNVSLKNNPDRFSQTIVFNTPDPSGTKFTTFAYNPDSNQYYDITDDLASGKSINDALTVAISGDLGVVSKDVDPAKTALGFNVLRNQISVQKNGNIPAINSASILDDVQNDRVIPPAEDGFFKITPLPNGSFAIVDMTRGLPVADFAKEEPATKLFGDINEAYVELKNLNEQKSILASKNVVEYTGLIRNNPAFRLAMTLRTPEFRMIPKSNIAAELKKEDRSLLTKDFYSPEEAKKIVGAKNYDEMLFNFAQVEMQKVKGKGIKTDTIDKLISIGDDPNAFARKRSLSASKLKELGKQKNIDININDNNFKNFAKFWTGTSNWADMSNGQRYYLMSRVNQIEAMPQQIKFPNLFQRQYTKGQFENVLADMGKAKDGATGKYSVADVQKAAGVNKEAAKQIYDDLVYSGRAKPVPPGKIQLIKSEEDYRNERLAAARTVDEPFGKGPVETESAEQAASRMRGMGFSEESVQRVEQAAKQKAELPAKTTEATAQSNSEAQQRLGEAVSSGADPQAEKVAADFSSKMSEMLNKLGVAKLVKHRVATEQAKKVGETKDVTFTQAGGFDLINREIFVNISDRINDPTITEENVIDYINDIVNHEVIHVMREADLITENEWQVLKNFVRNAKLNKEILKKDNLMAAPKDTLMDDIRSRYRNSGLNEEQLIEEGIAEAYRLWVRHGNKFVSGKPASLFKRILNYIRSFASAFKSSGATSVDQIFSSIQKGEIGARTPGLSIFNPASDAEIRSLRLKDMADSIELANSRRTKKVRGVKKIERPDEDVEERQAVKLSEAETKRVDDFISNQIRNTPRGYIPRFNPNAPKIATNAALQFEVDKREPELPAFAEKYVMSAIAGQSIPNRVISKEVDRHGRIKSDPVTMTEKAIDMLESWTLGGFSEDFSDFSRVFRKAVIDRYNEFRRQEGELIGTENEGMLRAETSASAALGWLDRARGIMAQMLQNGGIKWVTKADMVTGDPESFMSDEHAGYHDIDTSVPGLLDALSKVMDGSVPNGMGIFKTYSTFKRIQGFRQRARAAALQLQNSEGMDAATKAALEAMVEAEKKVRLIDNPSDQRISEFISEVDADYPQVSEAYGNYQNWNKTLIQFGVDTGILTEELAEDWKNWGDYFPFYEEIEKAIVNGQGYKKGSSLTRADFLFKELAERAKDLDQADPFEMITKNAYGILVAGLKNVAANRIMRNSVLVDEAREVTKDEAKRLRSQGRFVQAVLKDGIEHYYEIADPLLFESMMNYGESALGQITKIASAPAELLREMVTREPGFILLNMLRDTVSTYITSGVDYIPFIDSFKEFNSDEMQKLIDLGVVGGYDLSADPKDLKKYVKGEYRKRGVDVNTHSQTSSNMVRQLWDKLGQYSQMSDGAVRTAVYRKVLEKTGSEAQARLAAIDVLNFSRRGANPLWRAITATIPFLNARIQGLDKIYTTLAGKYSPYDGLDQRSVTQKRALMRGGMIAAMTGIYFLMMSDNEEYKKARREVRDDNWIIPTPFEGVSFKLPIPFEIGAIFKTIPEVFLNYMFGDLDARGARDSIVRQINNTTNIDLLGFQIIKPLVDAARNKDSFTGKEIVPYWVERGTEAYKQYDERTTEISKALGKMLNISPMKIDYVIGGYGGSLGTSILLATNAAWQTANGEKTAGTRADWTDINNVPVIRRFLMDNRLGNVGTRVQQDYYELRDEVRKAVATLNKFKDEKDVDGYYAYMATKQDLLNTRQAVLSLDRYLKRYREARDQIKKSDLPPETVRKLLREIEDDKNMRLAVVPALRDEANLSPKLGSAVIDAFIG